LMRNMSTRIEKDAFGEMEVPSNALWGAQTQR
jgi:fumarate hydratase class II